MIQDCLGCRLANKLEPAHIVYEEGLITCFLDIAPLNEGHMLILPKKHYLDVDELEVETATAIMTAAAELSKALKEAFRPDGITVMQNGGKFNDLGHYHMHVFPRYAGDGFGWLEPENAADVKERLSEVKARITAALTTLKK